MNQQAGKERQLPWWVGLVVFAVLLSAILLFSVGLSVVALMTGYTDALKMLASPEGLLVQVIFMSLILAGLALGVPRLARISAVRWLRLNAAPPGVIAASVVGVLGLGFLVDEVTFLLHAVDGEVFVTHGLDHFNRLFAEASPVVFIFLTLTVSLGPGMGEELFFRGLVLRSFGTSMPGYAAIVLSSVMFGLIHFDALQSPGAGLIGLYLGFLVLRTGSLWPAIVAHAVNNLICALFARLTPKDAVPIWDAGHPMGLLAAALLVTALSIVALLRLTRDATGSPGDSQVS